MREPAVRPRRGYLARLVEMARGPDSNHLAHGRDRRTDEQRRRRRRGEPPDDGAERKAERYPHARESLNYRPALAGHYRPAFAGHLPARLRGPMWRRAPMRGRGSLRPRSLMRKTPLHGADHFLDLDLH